MPKPPQNFNPEPLDQVTQVRLTRRQMEGLRLLAAESDETIGGTLRALIVVELARHWPEEFGRVDDGERLT
jgi:hypothetical protein